MRLIDADALPEYTGYAISANEVAMAVENAPTIDAVPVVRCRDCIWYEIAQLKKDGTEDRRYRPSYCTNLAYHTRPDWFCADGERREDDKLPKLRGSN